MAQKCQVVRNESAVYCEKGENQKQEYNELFIFPNYLIPMSLISVMIKNNFSRNRANFDRFTNIDLKNLAFDQISRTWYYIFPINST